MKIKNSRDLKKEEMAGIRGKKNTKVGPNKKKHQEGDD